MVYTGYTLFNGAFIRFIEGDNLSYLMSGIHHYFRRVIVIVHNGNIVWTHPNFTELVRQHMLNHQRQLHWGKSRA